MTALDVFKETASVIYPRNEGNNICTWIGFKHVMYVVEEAVIDNLRQNNLKPRELYEENGLCFEILVSDARILHALHMDDKINAEVKIDESYDQDINEVNFIVDLYVNRDKQPVKAVVCRVSAQFKIDDSPVTSEVPATRHDQLDQWTVERISRGGALEEERSYLLVERGEINPADDVSKILKANNHNAMVWKWHIPYFYCHYNERLKNSGYLRLLEEVEDLFLANNGISIRTMLHEKKMIPVVPSARVEIMEEAYMEETLYTVYSLVETYRDFTYTHQMDCYVVRDGNLIRTATGRITHGYARINSRKDWSLVAFDDETLQKIQNNLTGK